MYAMAWKESLRDRWILANRSPREIRFIYCDTAYWAEHALNWESLRQYRKNHRESLRLLMGSELTPEFSTPEQERERVRRQRERIAPKTGGAVLKMVALQVPEDHLRYHEELQEHLSEHGFVTKARFSEYQMGYKDADGEAQVKDLKASRFEVKFENEPQWPDIAPVALERPLKRTSAEKLKDHETYVIAPDLQIPFTDEKALDVFYQILHDARPDTIIQLGDALDLTAYSRFIDSEIYADATQRSVVEALKFFATLRRLSPAARIVYLEGNHEQRLPRDILTNRNKNRNIRPADDLSGDPLISVPRMVGLKSVDVEYLPGYPNNRFWITDEFQVVHGRTTGRNEAKRVNMSEKVSSVYGHTHRLNHEIETVNRRGGADLRHTYGSGCLCRLDTHVPSTKTGYDLSDEPIGGHHENWQQGFNVITVKNGSFFVEQILINTFDGYKTLFRGKVYEPRV